jgi:hypothetical protein
VADFDLSLISPSPSSHDVHDSFLNPCFEDIDFDYPLASPPAVEPVDETSPIPITSILLDSEPGPGRSPNGIKMLKRRIRHEEENRRKMYRRSQPQRVQSDSTDLDHQKTGWRGIPLKFGAASTIPSLIGDGSARIARLRSLDYTYVNSPV